MEIVVADTSFFGYLMQIVILISARDDVNGIFNGSCKKVSGFIVSFDFFIPMISLKRKLTP